MRFGFREFWVANGGHFFLNGIPINLHATATWPPTDLQSSNSVAQTLLQVKVAEYRRHAAAYPASGRVVV